MSIGPASHEADMAVSLHRLVERAPLLVDRIDTEGRIVALNSIELKELKLDPDKAVGQPLETLYDGDSAHRIRVLLRNGEATPAAFPVWMSSPTRDETPMIAVAVADGDGGLALVKLPLGAAALGIGDELIERVEILSQMIGAATEACWCIEFLEPVDVSLAEDEIVERIFANQSRWRACNAAMARLYDVPEDLDFNTQPVSQYFPATHVNKAMIRDLVRAGYRLDHAAAVDQRHDGSEMLVENDFRAAIRDGFLIRLWGTTRDIGPHRRREQQLSERASSMLDILSAAPDPIIVLSEEGLLLAANPAAENAWGRGADQMLGRPIQQFTETRDAAGRLRRAALAAADEAECELVVVTANGAREAWRFRVAMTEGEFRRYVATARRKMRRRTRSAATEASP
ncbi:PAS domain S-box-containing protein [Mesorhizobium soli]|uniref:PAS domain-containing protein n=1 Tax=Pseudaminobacter soli (ex Li et al. 2025) TaxID=1295366 RepID=UPI0024735A25|nr:PAS domain-containing protein [Mesorhizobium soli]MDH6233877.1 PAS domain S-box-containing protein [Mesorhizobium soli]